MVVPVVNALQIQLFKYHDNRDLVLHIRQLTKVYVTIGKDIDNHKLQYFPNSLKEKATNWFGRYETNTTWAKVQLAFITQFSE
jgi:hypothetical protein